MSTNFFSDEQVLWPFFTLNVQIRHFKEFNIFLSLIILTYMVMEYCVGGLQDMLESAPGKKLPLWQAHE